jgi:hypothetical protein
LVIGMNLDRQPFGYRTDTSAALSRMSSA